MKYLIAYNIAFLAGKLERHLGHITRIPTRVLIRFAATINGAAYFNGFDDAVDT
jgi:hypothetical protein